MVDGFRYRRNPAMLINRLVLHRYFRGDWARLCFIAAIGLIGGYIAVISNT